MPRRKPHRHEPAELGFMQHKDAAERLGVLRQTARCVYCEACGAVQVVDTAGGVWWLDMSKVSISALVPECPGEDADEG